MNPKTSQTRTPEQKEAAKHGEQMFPLEKYITQLDDQHPPVYAHWHEEAEFTRILSGHGTCQIQLNAYEVTAGDILFIPPGMLHAITAPSGGSLLTETYVFHMQFLGTQMADICSLRYLSPISTQKLLPPVFFPTSHPLHSTLHHLFNEANDAYANKPLGFELQLRATLLQLVAGLLPYCVEPSSETALYSEHNAKLKLVLNYIAQHYSEDLSIPELAELCYFSEYYFMRFFKKYVNMSCLDYIKNYRLEKAAELLEEGNLSTLDISLSVGFRNLSYFHREFKKKYGLTPKKFSDQYKTTKLLEI